MFAQGFFVNRLAVGLADQPANFSFGDAEPNHCLDNAPLLFAGLKRRSA
jgi:hypothetical protein